jgi:hypothetical protein
MKTHFVVYTPALEWFQVVSQPGSEDLIVRRYKAPAGESTPEICVTLTSLLNNDSRAARLAVHGSKPCLLPAAR